MMATASRLRGVGTVSRKLRLSAFTSFCLALSSLALGPPVLRTDEGTAVQLPIDCNGAGGGGNDDGEIPPDCLSSDPTNSPGCYKHRSDKELSLLLGGSAVIPFEPPVVCGEVVDSPKVARNILRGSGDSSSPCNRLKRDALTSMLNIRRSMLFGDGLLGEDGAECFDDEGDDGGFRIVMRCGQIFLPDPDTPDPDDAMVVTEKTPLATLVMLASALCEEASCPPENNAPCGQTLDRLANILNKINESRSHDGTCALCKGDETPPVLDCPTELLTFECQGPEGTPINYRVTATDDCDPNPQLVSFPPPGTPLPLGAQRTVQCAAKDLKGNVSCCSFDVVVVDTTPPTISCPPGPIVVDCVPGEENGAVVDYPPPAVSDISGAEVDVVCDPPSGSFFPFGATTVTCIATDSSGNAADCSVTIEVVEETPPTLTCPGEITVECTSPEGAEVEYPPPMLSETCEPPPDPVCEPPPGSVFPLGTTAVSCSTVDRNGDPVACQFSVTVEDTQRPTIVCPQDLAVECSSPDGTPVSFEIAAQDVCDSDPAVACEPPPGSRFPLGSTVVDCVAADASGNQSECQFTVTVVDSTPPDISCPQAPITAPCDLTEPETGGAKVNYPPPMVADVCDGNATVACDPPSGSVFLLGSTTVICTATDASGNPAECSFSVTVIDETPPDLVCVDDVVQECTSPQGAMVEYPPPVVANECNGPPTVVCAPPSGSLFDMGSTTVNCTATDQSQNAAECSFSVTVDDTTPPNIVCPADKVVECETHMGTQVEFTAAATDACDPAPAVECVPPPGNFFPLGVTVVECTATDMHGNSNTCEFNISVVDTTPPILTCPEDIEVECESPDGAPATFAPNAVDACDPDPDVLCDPPSGSTFPIGTTRVTCTATDASNNQSQCHFEVNVVDTTPPVITCSEDAVTVECDQPNAGTIQYPIPIANDICDPELLVQCDPPPGTVLPLGRHTVACVATDSAGNSQSCSFEVVVSDTIPPDLVCLEDFVRECDGADGREVAYSLPTATDTCDPAPNVSCLPAPGSLFPFGDTLVTCTADDQSGNMIQCTFTVTIQDTTAPLIECPGNIETICTAQNGTPVSYGVSAVDLCDPAVELSCSPPSGSRFPLGETTVTCNAEDSAANTSSCSFSVTVTDPSPPQIACPKDFERECESEGAALVEYPGPSVFDTCDAAPQVSCEPPSGTRLPLGPHVIRCTAVDETGNEASCEFTVTVVDNTAPVLVCPPNLTVQCESSDGSVVSWDLPVANDACDGQPPVSCEPPPGSLFPLGDTEVVCMSTDRSGNTTQCSFFVSVVDTLPPAIICPEPIVAECTGPDGSVVDYEVTATDACDPNPELACDPPPGSLFPLGESSVICRATDVNGNEEACAFRVTVVDSTPPAITCPEDIEVECTTEGEEAKKPPGWPSFIDRDPIPCTTKVTFPLPETSDVCQPAGEPIWVDCNPPSGTRVELGSHMVTCRARDAFGNESECSFTIDVAQGLNTFIRADANEDSGVDIGDSIRTLSFLFRGGEPPRCMDSADANDDARVDMADAIFTLQYKFMGGARPNDPFMPFCGLDRGNTPPIGCDRYAACE